MLFYFYPCCYDKYPEVKRLGWEMLYLVYSSRLQSIALHGNQGDRNPQLRRNKTALITFWLITPTLSRSRERVRASHTNNVLQINTTDMPSDETMLDNHHWDALPSDSRWHQLKLMITEVKLFFRPL